MSQDLNSASFGAQGGNPPPAGQVPQNVAGASARAATQHPSFDSSIPSRQPGTILGSFGTHSIPRWEEGDCLEEDNQRGAQTEHSQVEDAVPVRPESSFEAFFTQVEFEIGNSVLPESRHPSNNTASQSEQASNNLSEVTPTDDSQQAAQIVPPLAAEAPLFHTQNEEDFFTASEEYEVVPETLRKNSGRSHG